MYQSEETGDYAVKTRLRWLTVEFGVDGFACSQSYFSLGGQFRVTLVVPG